MEEPSALEELSADGAAKTELGPPLPLDEDSDDDFQYEEVEICRFAYRLQLPSITLHI
jgi:hypothetical protein